MAQRPATEHGSSRSARIALTKFRPPALPAMLVTRPTLHNQLAAGASQQLTVVVGSAGARQERAAGGLGSGTAARRDFLAVL